ncbi:MAG: vanadium-dependent haloperoxidase [Saprospiraceae bacterium]|nr:vanadium-dependent haloperoxidase [Saprospiraceae bacterium]
MLKNPIYALLFFVFLISCSQDVDTDNQQNAFKKVSDYDYKVSHDWNEVFLQIEKNSAGYRPGPAPRAVAYLGLAVYEAVVPGMSDFNSFEGYWNGFSIPDAEVSREYCWPLVVNASYGYLLPKFFGRATQEQLALIQSTERRFESQFKNTVSEDVFLRSINRGREVAEAVWQWSTTDKLGQLCRKPIPYSEDPKSHLYAQAIEVYSQNTPTLSYEAEWVGEFWSDDLLNLTFSPGVRFLAIGDQALVNEESNLETAVWMTALVGLASSDAGIACWHSKYYYNVERPETYIKRVIDPTWEPNLDNPLTGDKGISPSFPAYPSGHSTMGAAGGEALSHIFGYSYGMTDKCHQFQTLFEGTPRTFSSINEMADENAWSRVPLGVHYRMDCEEGVRFGREIARAVIRLPWKK